MRHEMRLDPTPFKMIYDGQKTIELRLYDEKRRAVSVGDTIVFISTENPQFRVVVKVTAMHVFSSFAELYEALPLDRCGYGADDTASPDDMLAYYSEERQRENGVVGIEFEVSARPYRDLYRFEPFLAEIAQMWQRVPDWRFGQLMLNFQGWLASNKLGDGFYCEDDKYIELMRRFFDELFSNKE